MIRTNIPLSQPLFRKTHFHDRVVVFWCVCGCEPSTLCPCPSPLTYHSSLTRAPLTTHLLPLISHPSPFTPHHSPLTPHLSPLLESRDAGAVNTLVGGRGVRTITHPFALAPPRDNPAGARPPVFQDDVITVTPIVVNPNRLGFALEVYYYTPARTLVTFSLNPRP